MLNCNKWLLWASVVCTLVVVALVSSADKATIVWYVAKS